MAQYESRIQFSIFGLQGNDKQLQDAVRTAFTGSEFLTALDYALNPNQTTYFCQPSYERFELVEVLATNFELKDAVEKLSQNIIAKLPNSSFEIEGTFNQLSAEGQALYTREYKDHTLNWKDIYCPYDFCGDCPECGNTIVWLEDYDPEETYHCDDCDVDLEFEDQEIEFEKGTIQY